MEHRKLGESMITFPVITFGAWAIGEGMLGGADRTESVKAIRKAHELGSCTIDTGAQYGLGLSEEVVAEAFAGIPRDKFQVHTKCGMVWEGNKGVPYLQNERYFDRILNFFKYAGKESIIRECEDSLRRLKTDYIDLYSIHWPDSTTPVAESMEALELLQQQGKIRAAGVCNHTTDEMHEAVDTNLIDLACNKVRYSMLNRGIEKDLIPYSIQNKKGILAYCILQRGLLSGENVRQWLWRIGENPREAALYKHENRERITVFLNKLMPLAQDYGVTLSQLAIHWAIRQPGITIALLGATSPDQVVHDAKAASLVIDNGDTNTIDLLVDELQLQLELDNALELKE